ncbi:hypothetical protein [Thermoproteus tenax]|uniref:Uncharacterized protein n=1 Tax=Thermoproteus tenax (strain ATCC 35583 / DSM 2078 / JCM 9277 / NBRC 100435 / Kra 1) TaxID=768679 RepID=G4RMQ3_THETK|nr:hypothetical protein [Thermoproteus tenax]CCC82729.1 hypothetical protein TTX_2117 [Thermoproteus tenax Kra 1]
MAHRQLIWSMEWAQAYVVVSGQNEVVVLNTGDVPIVLKSVILEGPSGQVYCLNATPNYYFDPGRLLKPNEYVVINCYVPADVQRVYTIIDNYVPNDKNFATDPNVVEKIIEERVEFYTVSLAQFAPSGGSNTGSGGSNNNGGNVGSNNNGGGVNNNGGGSSTGSNNGSNPPPTQKYYITINIVPNNNPTTQSVAGQVGWSVQSGVQALTGTGPYTGQIQINGQTDTLKASIVLPPSGYSCQISPTQQQVTAGNSYTFTITCTQQSGGNNYYVTINVVPNNDPVSQSVISQVSW